MIRELSHRKIAEMTYTEHVESCAPSATIKEVVELMDREGFGSVVICEHDKIVGIFTERDCLKKIVHKGLDPNKEKVADHMTRNPESLTPDDPIGKVLLKMRLGKYRHMIITDQKGTLLGIVSIRDVVNYLMDYISES